MHLVLQWAQLQPRIIYDETILRRGLDEFRVLVMPCCDVLTRSVASRISEFQKKGGIIVSDEHLAPALKPDILIRSYRRTRKAADDKAALQARAADLRRQLDPLHERYCDSSDPDVVVRLRRYGSTDYLFALNDRRTFGSYVGHHGLVMEKGIPHGATISLRRGSGHVYDLLAGKPVSIRQESGKMEFPVRLGPGDGRLFLITDHRIAAVRIDAPSRARLGGQVRWSAAVVDAEGKPLDAVVPLKVEILDPQNRPAESSGYYGARDGKVDITLDLARNDPAGEWTLRVRELASGLARERKITVTARGEQVSRWDLFEGALRNPNQYGDPFDQFSLAPGCSPFPGDLSFFTSSPR
jgi:hypothetical protein